MTYQIDTFGKLLSEEVLRSVFYAYLVKGRSVGVDGINTRQFEERLDDELATIQRKIGNGSYHFSRYKERLIPRGAHRPPRQILIPTNRDKLVLRLLYLYLSGVFVEESHTMKARTKIKHVFQAFELDVWDSYIKVDVKNFFPGIQHHRMLKVLEKQIEDTTFLSLLGDAIGQGAESSSSSTGSWQGKGLPQGLSVSPLLSSIFMKQLDEKYIQDRNIGYFRFVDDILILCRAEDLDTYSQQVDKDIEGIGLEIHPFSTSSDKSARGSLKNQMQFLGYLFENGQIGVRPSSLNRMYDRINKIFIQYWKYAQKPDLDELYTRLNYRITGLLINGTACGWLFYFSRINQLEILHKLDVHVKKSCKRFRVPWDKNKIKTFSRSYYEIRKFPHSNYIPSHETDDYEDQSERKNELLEIRDEIMAEVAEDVGAYGGYWV